MRTHFTILIASALALPHMALADGHANALNGVTVVVTNTFQGEQTKNIETDVSAFGLRNNQFATVGDAIEYPDFITLYTIDIAGNQIAFTWGDSDFAQQLSGPTPAGNHDRNYFVFDLPEGKAITAIALDEGASELLKGSVAPTAAVLGPNRVVTDFASGVIRGQGFNPVYTVTVTDAE